MQRLSKNTPPWLRGPIVLGVTAYLIALKYLEVGNIVYLSTPGSCLHPAGDMKVVRLLKISFVAGSNIAPDNQRQIVLLKPLLKALYPDSQIGKY